MRADLEWFRTFKAIYETGTMSDAAKELHISQPGVSLHLNSLETYIGHPLFERSTRKMLPNERAKMLYQQVNAALSKLEEVENSFRKKSGTDRLTLSVGMYPGLFHQLLEEHIADLNFNVVVHLEDNSKLLDLLENGTVDLTVTTEQVPIRNIEYQELGKSGFILVAGKETDVEDFRSIDPENKKAVKKWLQSQLWYSTADETHINTFWRLNFNREPDFAPNYIVPNKFSILKCLAHSTGLAVLPASICMPFIERGDIVALWKGYTEMTNTLYMGQRKKTMLHEEIEKVKEIIVAEFVKSHPE
ncbi:MAG: LysR family transcriptional regulator [Bacteroides sp.]|nr:LysR family transcriptional regulator [Bacteroides sp.]